MATGILQELDLVVYLGHGSMVTPNDMMGAMVHSQEMGYTVIIH